MDYIVFYWDAYGNAHHTEKMDKKTAEATVASMRPEQEARIVYIRAAGY